LLQSNFNLKFSAENFQYKEVEKKAQAAKDLCGWCLAMNVYADVSKKVGPKKE
jgi:hypothetical protein